MVALRMQFIDLMPAFKCVCAPPRGYATLLFPMHPISKEYYDRVMGTLDAFDLETDNRQEVAELFEKVTKDAKTFGIAINDAIKRDTELKFRNSVPIDRTPDESENEFHMRAAAAVVSALLTVGAEITHKNVTAFMAHTASVRIPVTDNNPYKAQRSSDEILAATPPDVLQKIKKLIAVSSGSDDNNALFPELLGGTIERTAEDRKADEESIDNAYNIGVKTGATAYDINYPLHTSPDCNAGEYFESKRNACKGELNAAWEKIAALYNNEPSRSSLKRRIGQICFNLTDTVFNLVSRNTALGDGRAFALNPAKPYTVSLFHFDFIDRILKMSAADRIRTIKQYKILVDCSAIGLFSLIVYAGGADTNSASLWACLFHILRWVLWMMLGGDTPDTVLAIMQYVYHDRNSAISLCCAAVLGAVAVGHTVVERFSVSTLYDIYQSKLVTIIAVGIGLVASMIKLNGNPDTRKRVFASIIYCIIYLGPSLALIYCTQFVSNVFYVLSMMGLAGNIVPLISLVDVLLQICVLLFGYKIAPIAALLVTLLAGYFKLLPDFPDFVTTLEKKKKKKNAHCRQET